MAAFSGPSTGRPLGRSGPNQGPNHPGHAPLGLLGRFGALINGLPPPDLDHSPGRWESTVETTDAGWADYPMISTEQCPRLSIERRKHHAVRQRGGISFRFTSVTFSTARGSRSWSRVLFP